MSKRGAVKNFRTEGVSDFGGTFARGRGVSTPLHTMYRLDQICQKLRLCREKYPALSS